MTDRTLTVEELAIANGAACCELLTGRIRFLKDLVTRHVAEVEESGHYFAVVSVWRLRDEVASLEAIASTYAGTLVAQEREILGGENAQVQ